ncbi:MAG: hypothetical protein ACQEXE_16365 [Bacillota bacterium]
MFFKRNEKIDRGAVNLAYFMTFVFWGTVLFINTFFEWFYNKQFISSSLTILIIGLVVFFLTEFIATRIKKSQADKCIKGKFKD